MDGPAISGAEDHSASLIVIEPGGARARLSIRRPNTTPSPARSRGTPTVLCRRKTSLLWL
jgi:hypothetical protein